MTVSSTGTVQRRIVQSETSHWSVDAAVDAFGRMHVLLDTDHLVFMANEWKISNRTPWQEAGVVPESARFVPGASTLTWAFQIDGAQFGAPRRTEIYGFGGGPAGLIWPWFTRGSRAVLVAEKPAGFGTWVVLEPQGRESTFPVGVAADRQGNVHTLYERSRGGMGGVISYRYACIGADIFGSDTGRFADAKTARIGDLHIRAVVGEGGKLEQQSWGDGRRLAVDPASGTTLVGTDFLVQKERWSGPLNWPLAKPMRVDLVPAGGDVFQALAVGQPRDEWWGKEHPIYYLAFSGGKWSDATELGVADVASFWGQAWQSVGIANAGNNKAFLVWPT